MEDAATAISPQVHNTAPTGNGRNRGRRPRDRAPYPNHNRAGYGYTTNGVQPAGYSYNQQGYQPRPVYRPPTPHGSSSRPLICFNCNGHGHHYKMCPSPRTNQPPPQAHYSVSPSHQHPSWTLDSGATHHLTNDLANLALHSEYRGTEQVQLSDGLSEQTDSLPRPE
ncbi:Retrovirus-related Pol polyprotein from transposon RE1 [Linum perenne]